MAGSTLRAHLVHGWLTTTGDEPPKRSVPMVNLQRVHTTTVTVEGVEIQVELKRLTFEEAEAHRRTMETIRLKTRRQRAELEKADTLAAEELDTRLALHHQEDLATEAQVRQAIEAYVTVGPGQLAVDGHEIRTGADLLGVCGDPFVYLHLMGEIEARSRVGASLGKASGSPSGSTRSSGARAASGPAAPGPRPEEIADAADSPAMTVSEGVTAAMDTPSFGSTALSS